MSFTLGYAPEKFKVVVAAGSDFFSALTRKDGVDWPSDAELILDFGNGITWDAVVGGVSAMWTEDQVDVDALIATKPKSVKLWYVSGGTRLLWAQGTLTVS